MKGKAWIRAGISFTLALMLASLLMTGDIGLFINPRFKWLIGISIGILVTLTLIQIWHAKERELHRVGFTGYLFMSLPLLAFLLFPPAPLDASMVGKKGVNLGNPNQPSQQSTEKIEFITEDPNEPYQLLKKQLLSSSTIVFTEESYGRVLNAINISPADYKGKKVKVYGFVYRDQTLKKDEFVIGRYALTCCTADAAVYGFSIKEAPISKFKNNQWHEITGTLDTEKYEGYEIPVIKYASSQKIKTPKEAYIYFNY